MHMDVEALEMMLREYRAEWETLISLLDAHPETSLHDPVSPPWTSRDVYAHLARWMELSTSQLEAVPLMGVPSLEWRGPTMRSTRAGSK